MERNAICSEVLVFLNIINMISGVLKALEEWHPENLDISTISNLMFLPKH